MRYINLRLLTYLLTGTAGGSDDLGANTSSDNQVWPDGRTPICLSSQIRQTH